MPINVPNVQIEDMANTMNFDAGTGMPNVLEDVPQGFSLDLGPGMTTNDDPFGFQGTGEDDIFAGLALDADMDFT